MKKRSFLKDYWFIICMLTGIVAGCIVGAAHNGHRGNPCLFPARFFPELCALEGDRGGSSVIRRHEDALRLVEAAEPELFDCDTKQALEILRGQA